MKITKINDRLNRVRVDLPKGGEVTNLPYPREFASEYVEFEYDPTLELRHLAEINLRKREGGTYIYSNNPEMLAKDDIGKAVLRTKHLKGEIFFTYEHSNHTGEPAYFGYQLFNKGDSDAVIKVRNIGFQIDGEWLGQRSWSDFYNTRLELPSDYFIDGKENELYKGGDYVDYTPRVYEPQEYVLPAGKYFYVIGGTTEDAYNNINVDNTANRPILPGRCSNAVVLFDVSGGDVQGTFYVYNNVSQVKDAPDDQGYIVTRNGTDYSAQYKGVDHHKGVIDTDVFFAVNEKTVKGKLPVLYQNKRDPYFHTKTEPYQKYDLVEYNIADTKWLSALNPNNNTRAIGTDMMTFECVTESGETVVIDNERADGKGNVANTGNWMVQYSDDMTLVNVGNTPRTFKIYKKGATAGALMSMIRDENGAVLDARLTVHPYSYTKIPDNVNPELLTFVNSAYWYVVDGKPYFELTDEKALVWTQTVEPMSSRTITVDYLVLGNSCGGVNHWVELD